MPATRCALDAMFHLVCSLSVSAVCFVRETLVAGLMWVVQGREYPVYMYVQPVKVVKVGSCVTDVLL